MREQKRHARSAASREIAARQHGVVTAAAASTTVGLGTSAISRSALKRGRLHRIHRGVYAVGHRGLSLHGRFMAAVLACGEGAVLSHVSAAVLWELLQTHRRPGPRLRPIHLGPQPARRGIHLHRCPSLNAARRAVSLALLLAARRRARETAPDHPPPQHPRHERRPHPRRPPRHLAAPAAPPPPRHPPGRAQGLPPRRQSRPTAPARTSRPLFLALVHHHALPAPRGQRQARPLGSRLPLALAAPRRRDRLLDLPPRLGRLRGRPRPRPRPARAPATPSCASRDQQLEARTRSRRRATSRARLRSARA